MMDQLETLRDIETRLVEATGPNREIDAQITAHFNGLTVRRAPITNDFGPSARWNFYNDDGDFVCHEDRYALTNKNGVRAEKFLFREYTASLDASVALCEEVLPDEETIIAINGSRFRGYDTRISEYEGDLHYQHSVGAHKDKSIALLIAIVRALIEKEQPLPAPPIEGEG